MSWLHLIAVASKSALVVAALCLFVSSVKAQGTVTIAPSTLTDVGEWVTIDVTDTTPAIFDCNDNGTPDLGICAIGGTSCSSCANCALGGPCVGADDGDCDDDCVRDVGVYVFSEAQPEGLRLICNETVPNASNVYECKLPVSVKRRLPGTILIGRNGTSPAVLRAQYDDTGIVHEAIASAPFASGRIVIESYRFVDNGDIDGVPDTNETVDTYVTVVNRTGIDLHNVWYHAYSTSTSIACLGQAVFRFDDLPAGGRLEILAPVRFRVASVNRASLSQNLSAEISFSFQADEFDLNQWPQNINFDLDLDFSGKPGAAIYRRFRGVNRVRQVWRDEPRSR
jgi:hypothetical protein